MKKVLKFLASAIGITIIGITLEFNGIEIKEVKNIIISLVNFSKEESKQLSSTEYETMSTTEMSTVMDTGTPMNNSQPINVNVKVFTSDDKGGSSDIIDGNSSPVATVTSTTEEPTKSTKEDKKSKDETKKGKKRKNKDKSSATTTKSSKVDESVMTTEEDESLEFAEDNDTSQMRKMSCDVKINTPGQLVLLSDDEDEQSGNMYISYSSDASGNALTDSNIVEYSVNDLVNQSGLVNNQEIKYIDVIPGVYTFNFENCQFGNVDVYIFDDINSLINNQSQNEINDAEEEESINVPSQDIINVPILEQNHTYRKKVSTQYDFIPKFIFYSENNVDGIMRILDEESNELQLIELYGTGDECTQVIDGNIMFEFGKTYYIEITSSSNIVLDEYVYYFQVIE